jgi:hypothetical protein
MSELTTIKFELSLIYGLTDDGLIESSLRATDKEARTLYAESYSSEHRSEGYFQPNIDRSSRLKIAFCDQVLSADFVASIFETLGVIEN